MTALATCMLTISALSLLACGGTQTPPQDNTEEEDLENPEGLRNLDPPAENGEEESGLNNADGDLLVDSIDECPNEPETDNGVDDADGCPD